MSVRRPTRSVRSRGPQHDLHGNVPDNAGLALVLVDVVNDFEFEGGERMLPRALEAARNLAALKARAQRAGVPCVYANDNFGRWRSDFAAQVRHCLSDGVRGETLVRMLMPKPRDYFVLKPKHSAFYQTCLSILLAHLGAKTLLLGGYTTDSCISFTAHDAYLRGYELVVLRDGTCASVEEAQEPALAQMARALRAATPACADVTFVRRNGDVSLRLQRPRSKPARASR